MNDHKTELENKPLHLQHLMDQILEERYTNLDQQSLDCQELLRLSEQSDYQYGIAFAITYLGDYHLAHNDSHLAGENLAKALEICEKNQYKELLMNAHIFSGIYYDMLLDRQMSLNHTLNALELGTQLGDDNRKSVIINNIANIFEYFGDFEAALKYYKQAHECIHDPLSIVKNSHHYALLIANLVYISCILGDTQSADTYTQQLAAAQLDNTNGIAQYYRCLCHLAAANQDLATLRENTDKLLSLLSYDESWEYQFFEMLIYVADHLLNLKDDNYAKRVLLALGRLCGEGEEGNQLRVQAVWVHYYELFGTEAQQGWAYKRYYKLKQIVDVSTNNAMAEGLHARIKLYEATKQQQEMRMKNKALENQAQIDEMTQVFNRRSFTKLVDQVSGDMRVRTLGFAMIDVDYFKEYNDCYGHAKGDETLRAVAECMKLAAGNNKDIYNFRYGGDEFVCMYANCTASELEQLMSAVKELMRVKHIAHKHSRCSDIVSLSIGFSIGQRAENGEMDAAGWLAQADKALYWSKGRGRNSCSKYGNEMDNVLAAEKSVSGSV